MKMSFRWYGASDPVSLQYIRQIPGMHGIVSAVYDVSVGEVWPLQKIEALKPRTVNSAAELDALPHESVIRDSLGDVYEKWSPPDESMTEWMTPGTSWTPAPTLPATVLFTPGDAG